MPQNCTQELNPPRLEATYGLPYWEFTAGEVDKAVMHCAVRRLRPANGITTLGNMQLIQTEGFGQNLSSQGQFGEHGGDAVGTFLALWRVQQNEWLNLPQLFQELLHRNSVPGSLRLFMEMLQQGDAEHAIKRMDANLAIGPVIHRSPSQPVAVLQAAKDSLDFLLAGMAHSGFMVSSKGGAAGIRRFQNARAS